MLKRSEPEVREIVLAIELFTNGSLNTFAKKTNVDAGHGLIKVGSSLVPFANKFPKNTKLYKLMTTKPGEGA